LGFQIGRFSNKVIGNDILVSGLKMQSLQYKINSNPRLLIPIKRILERFLVKGYVRKLPKSNRYKGCGVGFLTFATDRQIVVHFSEIIKNYVNYYVCANKRSTLWSVIYSLRESCYLTIAWKHKMSNKRKVIEKYGSSLRIHENGKLITELFYPTSLKTELKFLERSYDGFVTNLTKESNTFFV
jgi:hypothetical protein